jgi:hypothetical protein
MKISSKNIKAVSGALMLLGMASIIGSCNKELAVAEPIVYPPVNRLGNQGPGNKIFVNTIVSVQVN